MKKLLLSLFLTAAFAQEQESEIALPLLNEDSISFTGTLSDTIAPPEPLIDRPQKSSGAAVFLSILFPGLGHFYLEENKTGAGLMGTAGMEKNRSFGDFYSRCLQKI